MTTAALAQERVRVRGTIENVDGNVLTVKTREGQDVKVKLPDNARVLGLEKASIDDIGVLLDRLRADLPGVPVVLLGHSMGSFAVQQYLVQSADGGEGLDAVVLSGTASADLMPALDSDEPKVRTSDGSVLARYRRDHFPGIPRLALMSFINKKSRNGSPHDDLKPKLW